MRTATLATLVIAVFSAVPVFAFSPDQLNKITFDNTTGTTIEMIFLSPGDSKFWGPDIIGADYILKDGASVGYYVHYPGASFRFDVMATDGKGNEFEIRDLEITDGTEARVTLTPRSPKKATPDFTLATVRIDNRTGHEIQYLFVSPSDSHAWGADLLDEETTVVDRESCSFVLLTGKGKMQYSLMAIDEDNDEYQFDVTIDPKTRKEFIWAIEPGDLKKAK